MFVDYLWFFILFFRLFIFNCFCFYCFYLHILCDIVIHITMRLFLLTAINYFFETQPEIFVGKGRRLVHIPFWIK